MSADGTAPDLGAPVDLVVRGAELVATVDDAGTELAGGWVAVHDATVVALGDHRSAPPPARTELDARGALVTPGLVNGHHHLFQNLTRAWPPMTDQRLFGWMRACVPAWEGIDEEAAHLSAWVGLAELALSGCTTSTDMCYFHVRGAGDLVGATIRAATEVGVRFHPSRGCISTCGDDGGGVLPPSVVQDPDTVLAECERLVQQFHDPAPGAMVQVAFGPSMTFLVGAETTARMIELAERLDVRMHTHVAESADDDAHCTARFGRTDFEHFDSLGLCSDRTWVAHCVRPRAGEIERLATAGVGVAHCPTSNCIIGSGIAPVAALRAAGVAVGLGVDGSSSSDAGSLWMEARQALLMGKLRDGPGSIDARAVLSMATRGGAACLGRGGELGQLRVGGAGDLVVWDLEGPAWAGAVADPVEAWLRCGPASTRHTVVAGVPVVRDGALVAPGLDDVLARHRRASLALQSRATHPLARVGP